MSSSSSNSETPIIEQVITEFFAKSLHIILESRSPYVSSRNYSSLSTCSSPRSPSTGSTGPRDKWFNLALRDCPAALENFDLWRQSNLEPLIIDIVLVSRSSTPEKLLERWVIQYETRKQLGTVTDRKSSTGTGTGTSSMYKKTYTGSIVLLRSLYTLVRLLPAYNLFRELHSSGQVRPVSLSHRILPFANPLTRSEESQMGHFSIAPIETPFGKLSVSVWYQPVLEHIGSEPAMQLSTEFIPDYVGSPTTDPLKQIRTLTLTGSLPVITQIGRRHSWSNDPLGAVPVMDPHPLSKCNPKPSIPLPISQKGKRALEIPNSANAVLFRCDSAPAGRGEGQIRNFGFRQDVACEHNQQLVRYGEFHTGTSLPKEILTSGSRFGSRVYSNDRYDDSDIRYHFAQDDELVLGALNSLGNSQGEERSRAAVVGELLRMLKESQKLQTGIENPGFSSRTVADVLQELRDFMEIRNSILGRQN